MIGNVKTASPVAIVPVIDIKHGLVVRARAGDRDRYAPIVTPLSRTADPVDVALGLLGAYPADTLYIADLDAIEGGDGNETHIRRVAAACPGVALWVDAGIHEEAAARAFLAAGFGQPVLGSETLRSPALVAALGGDAILSLDFRGDAFLGPAALHDDASLWPDRVIVMTLARVGTGSGLDLARLGEIRRRAGQRRVFAAGGLGGPDDLAALVRLGVAGVLVASALHEGRLRP
jgi:HisA/HisF family protein